MTFASWALRSAYYDRIIGINRRACDVAMRLHQKAYDAGRLAKRDRLFSGFLASIAEAREQLKPFHISEDRS